MESVKICKCERLTRQNLQFDCSDAPPVEILRVYKCEKCNKVIKLKLDI